MDPVPPPKAFADLLQAALHDRDFRRSQAAAQALSRADEPSLAPVLAALEDGLLHADVLVQRRAAQLLAELGERARPALPSLIKALGGRRWTAREAAALALGQVGAEDTSARAALVECVLHDRTALVREAATRSLVALSASAPETVAALRAATAHAHARVRCRAIRALAQFASREGIVPALAKALTDSHLKVRRAAAEVLGNFGASALSVLPALLRRRHDRDKGVAKAAAQALEQLGGALPSPLADWLQPFTAPSTNPSDGLRALLERPGLPEDVQARFRATCQRRARWHRRLARGAEVAPELPAGSAWDAARVVLAEVNHGAVREQEAAWLAAWWWEELLRGVEAKAP
ncbi:MAG: HEAT repeat domain-containing protein [Gemmataceae bacterium]|nr:HEAT repeat domain-containing protein [Gemmataceae bacterium]